MRGNPCGNRRYSRGTRQVTAVMAVRAEFRGVLGRVPNVVSSITSDLPQRTQGYTEGNQYALKGCSPLCEPLCLCGRAFFRGKPPQQKVCSLLSGESQEKRHRNSH